MDRKDFSETAPNFSGREPIANEPRPNADELFDFHGHLDGFCFRYCGHVVGVWPTQTGAVRGMTLAKEALRMLERTLAQPLMNTQRKAA